MTKTVGLLGIVLTSGLLVAAGCGNDGDDDDNDDGTGGVATGGYGTGGFAVATGGTGTGGGPNDEGCPATAPTDGDDCEATDGMLFCTYSDAVCTCSQFGPSEGTWDCQEMETCPATMPRDGSGCLIPDLSCTYDDGTCVCESGFGGPGGGQEWNCDGGSTSDSCPQTPPDDGDNCATAGEVCDYGGGAGTCVCTNSDGWLCSF